MLTRWTVPLVGVLLSCFVSAGAAAEARFEALFRRINALGSQGDGNQDAAAAWKELVAHGADALLPTLAALGEAKPIPANWLRTAVDAIVEKERLNKRALPLDQLEAFVKERARAPRSRRRAYELLVEADPKAPERLLPGMIDDPSVELRRDAIAAAIEQATPLIQSDPKRAEIEFRKLFAACRHQDQAEQIAKTLRKLDTDVDLTAHFGFIAKWVVVGPFDSPNGSGYLKPFEPEHAVDLSANYQGKDGKPVKWHSYWTFDTYGSVDLNEALGKHKDAAGYAFAAIESPAERPVEIRLGSIVAVEVFLNGTRVFNFEEHHHGQRMDQYVGRGTLKAGRNELLVKLIQNNQTESWAQEWTFQLRLCDETGGAIPLKLLTAN
jgi:hypothetical protein